MQRRDALLVRVCRIELAAVEQLLDGPNLAQTRQLHDVLLHREAGLLVGHIVELMLSAAVAGCHLGGPADPQVSANVQGGVARCAHKGNRQSRRGHCGMYMAREPFRRPVRNASRLRAVGNRG